MTKLQRLYEEFGQSPWLDNLRRDWILGGELQAWVDRGIRGVTSNPSIFQKAMAEGDAYDEQLAALAANEADILDAYWTLVVTDIEAALAVLRPVHDRSDGEDGFVSVEVAPDLAHDTPGTIHAARELHQRIDEPNLYVKIPATAAGIPAIHAMIAEGRNTNITLIFSLDRYDEVMEAYLSGLEALDGDLSSVRSVASFFVSRVDTEVDRRLEEIGTPEALELRGRAAVAQAQVAYDQFTQRFQGERWEALVARGARVQRPLWASTSTKNPDYPDTLYVDSLIGPATVNTMPENTLEAFEDHGKLSRTIDAAPDEAFRTLQALEEIGIDFDDVGATLEDEGVAAFAKSFDELITALSTKAEALRA
jgi:transaldolase